MAHDSEDGRLGTEEVTSVAFPWVHASFANDLVLPFDASGLPASFKNKLAEKMAEGATPSEVKEIMRDTQKLVEGETDPKAPQIYIRLVTDQLPIPEISGGTISHIKPSMIENWQTWGERMQATKLVRVFMMIRKKLEKMRPEDVLSTNEVAQKISKLNNRNYDNDEILFFEIAKTMLQFWPSEWEKYLNDERISLLLSMVDSGANSLMIKKLIVEFNKNLL